MNDLAKWEKRDGADKADYGPHREREEIVWEPHLLPARRWNKDGVHYVVKDIPNDSRTGVLAPEILAAMKGKSSGTKRPQPCGALPGERVRLWEFSVERMGFPIQVTACCQERLAGQTKPGIVYFHGGGWRMGSRADVQQSLCLLAQRSGAVVFNVEYRLAQVSPYPCATDDSWQVVKYVKAHAEWLGVDPERITVAGDSAGGNLAAACARRDRNMRTGILCGQVLIYPVLSQIEPVGVKGYHFSLEDYQVENDQAKWIVPSIQSTRQAVLGRALYTKSRRDAACPDASPLLDKDFSRLPRTLLICAEYDYLTQQCRAYAWNLAQAGVDVTLLIYRGTTHGFMSRPCPQAEDLQKEFVRTVRNEAWHAGK